MSQVRWMMFRVSAPDRVTLKLARSRSHARCVIDGDLGPCVIGPSTEGSLEGDVQLLLDSDSIHVAGGQFDGGRCSSSSHFVGVVSGGLPGYSPALVVHLDSLAFEPHSRPFTCTAGGCFLAESSGRVVGGNLSVSLRGGKLVSVPILGLRSDRSHSRGRVWLDDSGIHVLSALENTFHVRVPEHDLGLRISLRTVIQGDVELPIRDAEPVEGSCSYFQFAYHKGPAGELILDGAPITMLGIAS